MRISFGYNYSKPSVFEGRILGVVRAFTPSCSQQLVAIEENACFQSEVIDVIPSENMI
jgi:hypothetical protein